jgi:hypothetical protein
MNADIAFRTYDSFVIWKIWTNKVQHETFAIRHQLLAIRIWGRSKPEKLLILLNEYLDRNL